LIVAALAIAALWRVGPPPQQTATTTVATAGTSPAKAITEPVTTIAEMISNNAIGREASLEHVTIRERVGDRFWWIGSADEHPVFVVLDPDVKRITATSLRPGARMTLIGIVRPAPTAEEAEQQWHLPAATATLIAASGTYLHVTEIR
jgi:selenophosphate synthetase-related protein